MLTVFNRKEVLLTYSMKDQADAREILANHQIKYKVKSSSNQSPGTRARTGGFGSGVDNAYAYRIFVHKNDWAKAKYLLAKKIKRR